MLSTAGKSPNNRTMTNQFESREMLRRPEFHLDRLPLQFRWEVTRRHPVYLQIWPIQVVGEPIDPAVSFEDLPEENASSLFFRDALQPGEEKG